MNTQMGTRTDFLRRLTLEIRAAVRSEGFEYVGSCWYKRQLAPNISGVVTLPSTIYSDDPTVHIAPSVGVTHELLADMLVSLSGQKRTRLLPSTVSSALGYLTPERNYTAYSFLCDQDISSNVRRLAEDLRKYGIPWMQAHQSIESMLQDMVDFKYCTRDQARFKLPIAYFLVGDHENARREILEGKAQVGSKQDSYSEQYRQFSTALLKQVDLKEQTAAFRPPARPTPD